MGRCGGPLFRLGTPGTPRLSPGSTLATPGPPPLAPGAGAARPPLSGQRNKPRAGSWL